MSACRTLPTADSISVIFCIFSISILHLLLFAFFSENVDMAYKCEVFFYNICVDLASNITVKQWADNDQFMLCDSGMNVSCKSSYNSFQIIYTVWKLALFVF